TISAALILVLLGIGWGLRPLGRLEEALGRRSSVDLRPLAHQVPAEVEPLVREINQLMERLSSVLNATRTFTGNASHQLRTPLAVAKANLELALRRDGALERNNLIKTAMDATTRCQQLVEGLLMLAQLDERGTELGRVGRVDLVEIARDITQDLAPVALRKQHRLEFVCKDEKAPVRGDRLLLSEAIRNLIDNAIKHCPDKSSIYVTVSAREPTQVRVDDNGPGIETACRKNVQERFVRGNKSADGAGLGLAITQEIARLHQAALILDRSKSGGLSAEFQFPRDQL
ncbi:MAG: HAMP domain-containing sensor histidine kinase, partial [Pseudomonadota bacterium]